MKIVPRTKVQAAAFAVVLAAIGALAITLAQAFRVLQCPLVQ